MSTVVAVALIATWMTGSVVVFMVAPPVCRRVRARRQLAAFHEDLAAYLAAAADLAGHGRRGARSRIVRPARKDSR